MAIYKYTLAKYLKAKSTWIIAVIAGLLIAFALGAALPFGIVDTSSENSSAASDYTLTVVMSVALVSSFLAIFSSVFAGFKAASMYKDEVEDGTFLVMLSKPMKRSTIIFMKWFALQTIILGYTVFVVGFYALGVLAFDKGDQIVGAKIFGIESLSSHLGSVFIYMLAILFVIGMIFSSIGLLLSTKLSVGSTIGISIALGVVIPITSIIGSFLKKENFKTFNNAELLAQESRIKALGDTTLGDRVGALTTNEDIKSIYKLGVSTGDSDGYSFGWVLDLNYQIKTLSKFAYEQAIPQSAKDQADAIQAASGSQNGGGLGGGMKTSSTNDLSANETEMVTLISHFQKSLTSLNPVIGDLLKKYTDGVKALLIAKSTDIDLTSNEGDAMFNALGSSTSFADLKLALTADKTKLSSTVIANFLDKLFTFDSTHNFMDIVSPKTGDIEYILRNQLYKSLPDLLSSISDSLGETKIDLPGGVKVSPKSLIEDYGKNLIKFETPLTSFLSNGQKIEALVNDGKIDRALLANIKTLETKHVEITGASTLFEQLPREDKNLLLVMMTALNNNKLSEVESTDYVNKNWLLIAYVAIALGLVPLAYWVVKKQDFR